MEKSTDRPLTSAISHRTEMFHWEEGESTKQLKSSQILSRKIVGWNELSLFQWCDLNRTVMLKNTWRTSSMHLLSYSKVWPSSFFFWDMMVFSFFFFYSYFLSSLFFVSALCLVNQSTNTEAYSSLGYASAKLWWWIYDYRSFKITVSNTQLNTTYWKAVCMHVVRQKLPPHRFNKTIWSSQQT